MSPVVIALEALKIVLLSIVAAVVFGIAHDQVTARICVEYFTIGHEPIAQIDSPTLLGFIWGTIATWWLGAILGLIAALAALVGTWPKLTARQLLPTIACLLVAMAAASLLAGLYGYHLASSGAVSLPEPLASRVPAERHVAFVADWYAHGAAYAVAGCGGLLVCAWIVYRRWRAARGVRSAAATN